MFLVFFFVGKKNSIFCEKNNVPQIFGTQFITFIFRWYCINRIYFNRLCNLLVVNVSIKTSYKLLIYALTLKTIYLTMKTKNYHHAFYLNSKQQLQTRIKKKGQKQRACDSCNVIVITNLWCSQWHNLNNEIQIWIYY